MTFLTFQVGNGTKSFKKCLFRAGVLQPRETKILVDLNLAPLDDFECCCLKK